MSLLSKGKAISLLAFCILFVAIFALFPSGEKDSPVKAKAESPQTKIQNYSGWRSNQRLIDLAERREQRQAEASPSIQAEANSNQVYSKLGNTSAKGRPNILYILTDDQPTETLRTMDSTLNWFRKDGKIFPNAYVATPICCPSRAEAMTGQYSHNNGITSNSSAIRFQDEFWMRDPFDQSQFRLFDDLAWKSTLQCDLYRNGYTNAMFGKYVNGWENKDRYNRRGSVPTCFDKQHSWMGFDSDHGGTWANELKDKSNAFPNSDDFLGRRTAEFIRLQKNKNKPWFAYVALHSPHLPLAPAPRYQNWYPKLGQKYRPEANERRQLLRGKPSYVKAAQGKWNLNTKQISLGQDRMVQSVDDTVKLLKQTLTKTQQRRNTLVIFTSDNGYLWGDHGLYNKFYPYLDSVHVPMMMIYPKRVSAGSTDRRIVSNIDIAPTVYDATGIEPMFHKVDGYSMLGKHRRDWFMIESGNDYVTPYWSAMITSRFHYIETGYDRTILGEPQTTPGPLKSTGDISYQEYYSLRNFEGQELNNLMSNPNSIPGLTSIQNELRWKSWMGYGRNPSSKGCYGTYGTTSINPCP